MHRINRKKQLKKKQNSCPHNARTIKQTTKTKHKNMLVVMVHIHKHDWVIQFKIIANFYFETILIENLKVLKILQKGKNIK